MIRLDGLKRQFGARVLFEDLSWAIRPGARVGLVGPNGVGKTTLLRLLAGVEQPDAGAVHLPRGARVGYLPQEVEAVEGGSVLDVVLGGSPEPARITRELEALAHELAGLPPGDARAPALTALYGELRERFEGLDGDRLEARARATLSGLGVAASRFHEPIANLSGGWRMRAVLARLLVAAPDLLLLDEPTNHLDLEALAWLEEFLGAYAGTFLLVSHDRYFLNRTVSEIAELERGRLTPWPGNYDRYLEQRAARAERLERAARQQAREVARVERFVERFRYKASKARQVQSRLHALSKLERVDTAARAARIRFGFPPAPRSGDVVVRAEGVAKRFGERRVYDGLELLLRRGSRLALVGPNGAGKSTLLRLLAGAVAPDAGRVELGHNVGVHYYAQHQLDALDPAASVLEEAERAAGAGERPRLRRLLGCFLFTGDDVDKRVGVLSGGEKARLALAKLLVRPANLLLLDEPTNHLDLQACEVLEEALDEYDGTLVVVSHDRYFINRVATSIGEVEGGAVRIHEGDYDEYQAWVLRREEQRTAARAAEEPEVTGRQALRAARREEAEQRNQRFRERQESERRLAPLEAEISALEARGRELERLQSDPSVYRDPERARETAREKVEIAARLERLYGAWEAVAGEQPGPRQSS